MVGLGGIIYTSSLCSLLLCGEVVSVQLSSGKAVQPRAISALPHCCVSILSLNTLYPRVFTVVMEGLDAAEVAE